MMPLIRPLPNASSEPTEYQKERAGFAKLKAELRQRKARARLLALRSVLRGLGRLLPGKPQARPRSAR
ncbi:hypothetical protein [uncultured Roseobacter sp.]|uniref:hypothetical protein n=1 Tax=uncultured Roseobacter sp. TaxID=114847 RepID=UPI002625DC19|nr:hypothetical protein [uncultured Roseobacter sp.]